MAVKNIYRNNPTHNAIGLLQARKSLYRNGPHYKAATTNPSYARITISGSGGSVTLPNHKDTLQSRQLSTFKTNPSLKSLTISEDGTEYGSKETVSWVIECYNRSDFKAVEAAACRHGSDVTVTFGYPNAWSEVQQQSSITLSNFILCSFAFNTTSEGYWVVEGTAVRATEALKKLELFGGIHAKGLPYRSGDDQLTVTGLVELMTHDAQNNGQTAIDDIDLSGNDGWVFKPNSKHDIKKDPGAVVVYKSSHLTMFSGRISKAWQGIKEKFNWANSTTSSVNTVYYSLGYVVNRLIMGQCHLSYTTKITDTKHFSPLTIDIDPVLSKSYIDSNIRSGIPTQVVLAGSQMGNYKGTYGSDDDLGIDFENVGGAGLSEIYALNQGAVTSEVDIGNILLERSVILDAMEKSANKDVSNADKTNDKSETEESVNILEFLKQIFKVIKEATGNAITLGFSQNPNNPNSLVIIDQNNGLAKDKFNVISFNSIDGDGSTRTLSLASRAGSPEMASSIMAGQTKQGDAVHNLSGKMGEIDSNRNSKYVEAQDNIFTLINSPASLIKSKFNHTQEESLRTAITQINQNKSNDHTSRFDLPTYPGLELSVTLDGTYGFHVGNGISSIHLPENYERNKAYFMVRSVTHEFNAEGSDWETSLSGILCYYADANYIKL